MKAIIKQTLVKKTWSGKTVLITKIIGTKENIVQKVNEYISYDDNTNTIKVTTSGTDGDTATLTIKVGDTNETVTITNKITYTCGGIEEV